MGAGENTHSLHPAHLFWSSMSLRTALGSRRYSCSSAALSFDTTSSIGTMSVSTHTHSHVGRLATHNWSPSPTVFDHGGEFLAQDGVSCVKGGMLLQDGRVTGYQLTHTAHRTDQ